MGLLFAKYAGLYILGTLYNLEGVANIHFFKILQSSLLFYSSLLLLAALTSFYIVDWTVLVRSMPVSYTHLDVYKRQPVFNTVADAVATTGADVSIIFVPPAFAGDAIMEAADAGIKVIVCITEGIPTKDMMMAKELSLIHI